MQHTPKIFTDRMAATAVAAPLQVGDLDGWTYEVERAGEIGYRIIILDEFGDFVAYWGDQTIV